MKAGNRIGKRAMRENGIQFLTWMLVRPRLVGSRSTSPVSGARVRMSALAFALELRNCQIMQRSNLSHFTGNTLY